MRFLLLFLLFLPTIGIAQNSKPVFVPDGRSLADLKMCQYPPFVTEILNGHFEKLGHFYSYLDRLDDKLKKQKPYCEYLLMKSFNVGIWALQTGDTTTLTVVANHMNPDWQLANAFDVTESYWNYQDWLIPVYKTNAEPYQVDALSGERELFRIRFTGNGHSGEQSLLLKSECFVCEG